MDAMKLVLVPCRISRGGFSSERVFRVQLADGAEHIAAAPVDYFLDAARGPLPPDALPPLTAPLEGYVAARIIGQGGEGTYLVSVPSGDVLRVSEHSPVPYPDENGHVPGQS